jgi:hypothetical protein
MNINKYENIKNLHLFWIVFIIAGFIAAFCGFPLVCIILLLVGQAWGQIFFRSEEDKRINRAEMRKYFNE